MAAGVTIPPPERELWDDEFPDSTLFHEWLKDLAKRKKIPAEAAPPLKNWTPPTPESKQSAVVYEDELPWNRDKGICFEIHELVQYRLEDLRYLYVWFVDFGGKRYDYKRVVPDEDYPVSEARLDWYRRDARMAILQAAHKDGVI